MAHSPSPRWDVPLSAAATLSRSCSPNASKPPQTHPLTPALPQLPPAARSSRCSAPAHSVSSLFSLFLRPICLHLRPSSQPAPQSTPSLHQLLPVPGPDPSRAPLWCLGGVRARHRPQPPIPSRVECGRDIRTCIHRPVLTLVPPLARPRLRAVSSRRPASRAFSQRRERVPVPRRACAGPVTGPRSARAARRSRGGSGCCRRAPR
jgi:hypothetical protein